MKSIFKKVKIIPATLLLISISATSQITKGNFMVGGSGYFNNSNAKNSEGAQIQSGSQIILQPNIGYFIYDRFVTGLTTRFGYSKTNGSKSSFGFGLGPFVRYYFLKTDKNINFLLEANYNYGKDFNTPDFNTTYGFKIGPVIYFNSSVGLELLAKYENSFISSAAFTVNSFQIGLGLQIHLEK